MALSDPLIHIKQLVLNEPVSVSYLHESLQPLSFQPPAYRRVLRRPQPKATHQGLRAAGGYSFPALEARSQNSRRGQGRAPPEASGEPPAFPSSWPQHTAWSSGHCPSLRPLDLPVPSHGAGVTVCGPTWGAQEGRLLPSQGPELSHMFISPHSQVSGRGPVWGTPSSMLPGDLSLLAGERLASALL